MRGIFSPDNKFGRWITKSGYLIILSWVWLLFSLPIITIGAASTALYDVIRRMLKDEEGMILQDYWCSFKSNFKQATIIWLPVLLGIAVIFYMVGMLVVIKDVSFLGRVISVIYAVVVVCIAVWVQVTFSYIARFVDKTKTVVRNAFLMCLMNPGMLFCVGLQTAIIAYCLYSFSIIPYLPLVLSLLPGAYSALLTVPMEKMFAKYILAAHQQQEQR